MQTSKDDLSTSVILEAPGKLALKRIVVPTIPGEIEYCEMRAVGICGSDVRYFEGENPWSLHTLGKNLPSPPGMVLGHEVAAVTHRGGEEVRVAILAYKSCGKCRYCREGNENLCSDMEHFGHSAGWGDMEHFPGGMAERFTIWRDFAYPIPDTISFGAATFLDGLAVALHSLDVGGMEPGKRVAAIGLGPIGMLAALAATADGAGNVTGCDTSAFPIELAENVGLGSMLHGNATDLANAVGRSEPVDIVIDTVGSEESIVSGLRMLEKRGVHVLLAVHENPIPVLGTALSGERSIITSSNNRYRDFPRAIELLAKQAFSVEPLITHRFPLSDVSAAFSVMLDKENRRAFKVIIIPD